MRAQVDMEMYVLTFLGKEHIKFTWNIQSAAAKIISFIPSDPSEPLKKLADCSTNIYKWSIIASRSMEKWGKILWRQRVDFPFVYELNNTFRNIAIGEWMLKNVMLWISNYGKGQKLRVRVSTKVFHFVHRHMYVYIAKPLWVMGTQQVTFHPKRTHSTEPY